MKKEDIRKLLAFEMRCYRRNDEDQLEGQGDYPQR